jgi:cytochrome P450
MENTLFLQSEVENPYEIYMRQLSYSPVFYDTKNNIVAVYSYDFCKQILDDPIAEIPQAPEDNGLNETATLIKNHLARRLNPPDHAAARKAAMELFSGMQPVAVTDIMEHFEEEIEWVESVCKKLPVLYLLKGFGFSEAAGDYFLQNIEALTRIMLPQRTASQNDSINKIAEGIYELIATQLYRLNKNLQPHYVSNLAGLLIQSYDACRGLLSNALLQILFHHPHSIAMKSKSFFVEAVTETLRFDPPVHNTRRVLRHDINLGGALLKNGQAILLVLAAANRDPKRKDNQAYLSFGSGLHSCLADQLSVNMAAETLYYLFNKYPKIRLAEQSIRYEPLINLRLPCSIRLRLGK